MSSEDQTKINVSWLEQYPGEQVACITIHRPAKINILNREAMLALQETILDLSKHPNLRCVILTGGGDKAFIGGADIKNMSELDPDSAREFITTLHSVCQAIRDSPVPVIARIHGYCLGAGMEIAAACDMRIASTDAQFGMPEVLVGIPSVIEAILLPRLIGWGKTNELLLTGKIISAEEADTMHFVERVVEHNQLDDALNEWLDAIIKAGSLAIRSQKKLMRKWESLSIDDGIQAGIDAFAKAYTTDEPRTYMQHFLKK